MAIVFIVESSALHAVASAALLAKSEAPQPVIEMSNKGPAIKSRIFTTAIMTRESHDVLLRIQNSRSLRTFSERLRFSNEPAILTQ